MARKSDRTIQKEMKRDIEKKMQALGIYRPEFDRAISTLTRVVFDYEKAVKEFDASGEAVMMPYTNKAGATNLCKNPLYAAIESLRRDMLEYLRELGLTPSAIKRINEQELKAKKKVTGLAAMIGAIQADD